ncbi:MOSC domain protein [Peziza echinospora]|nr:MOSC domain protein [Peziza echinospora]
MIITSLQVHPIKSLFPIFVNSTLLLPTGPIHDRIFMLVRLIPSGGKDENMHIGTYSQLCLFKQEFTKDDKGRDELLVTYVPPQGAQSDARAKNGLKPKGEGRRIRVPLYPDTSVLGEREVVMHGSRCTAWDMGGEAAAFFTECLGLEEDGSGGGIKLLYLGRGNTREVLGNVAPNSSAGEGEQAAGSNESTIGWIGKKILGGVIGGGGSEREQHNKRKYGITFSDCAALLVASEFSLKEVSRRFKEGEGKEGAGEMAMSKFRPNIVVGPESADENVPAWDEDFWSLLSITPPEGGTLGRRPVKVRLTANCIRCRSLNVVYPTGEFGDGKVGREEPLKLLQRDRRVDAGSKWSPVFGRYGFPVDGDGGDGGDDEEGVRIAVGDKVEVVERNEERSTFDWPGLSD